MNRTPAIIGFLIAGALILAVGFIAGMRDGSPADGLPALAVISPADGDSLSNPITLEFTTPAPLRLGTAGWMAGDMHLHLMAGDTELMPAASDITAGETSFTWQLPRLPAGTHRVYLTWAGRHHGNLAGTTDTLRLHIRD